ncbi:cupin domain-containing protein [Leucobacter weissii]|uniref:Cupin domain-containing protein n=2 Tax=Leucobacter weissii TaxID=1983706 RepID=A0A939MN45_9MICO|nr:cupin domain-containing protein [Leucobacter weissii]
MSLRSLASAIGVSPSLLSQVETGKTKPSVSTLYALVSHLGVSTDTLLGRADPAAAAVETPAAAQAAVGGQIYQQIHADDHPVLEMENGVRWEKLAVLDAVDVEALRVTYQPRGSSSVEGRLMRHLGVEHIYMLSGELTLHLGFETHIIRAGDSAALESQRPHMFVNHADEPAVGIWYITGRNSALQRASTGVEETSKESATGELNSAVDVLRAFRG